jgi:DNA-binding transcriptional ArsR family regulator
MDGRIVLDDKSFKALSADSRISIMKSLNERRRTLSELSQKLDLGNSTIKEHCDILVNAELIRQMDEGRKWKYYELTNKGKQIISPNLMEEVKVLIVLCFGVFAIGGIIMMISTGLFSNSLMQGSETYLDNQTNLMKSAPLLTTAEINQDGVIGATGARGFENKEFENTQVSQNNITQEFYAMSVLISMVMGVVIGWIFLRK